MLRVVRRPPPWPLTGYVCRSCRHQLQTARRFQSSTAPNSETHGGADDWYSNFNNDSTIAGRPKSTAAVKDYRPYKTSVGSRKTLLLEPEDEPRSRRLPRDHAGILQLARLPKEQLEERIQKARDQMAEIRQKPTNAEPAAERPSMKDREDMRTLSSHIGKLERALEVQREGNLPDQPRQTAFVRPAVSQSDRVQHRVARRAAQRSIFREKGLVYDKSNADLAKMTKDLEHLKDMLAARTLESDGRLGLPCTAIISVSKANEIALWAQNYRPPPASVIRRKISRWESAIADRTHGRAGGSASPTPEEIAKRRDEVVALRQQYGKELGKPWLQPMPRKPRALRDEIKLIKKNLVRETSANDSAPAKATREATQGSTDGRKLRHGSNSNDVKLNSIVADLKTAFLDNVRQSSSALPRESSLDAFRLKLETEAPCNWDPSVAGTSSVSLHTEGASPTRNAGAGRRARREANLDTTPRLRDEEQDPAERFTTGLSEDQEQDRGDVAGFFADSPAELAELPSATHAPTASAAAAVSKAPTACDRPVGEADAARERLTPQVSEGSAARERSPAKGLDELRRMLNVRIDKDDGDDRQRAVESNIKNYEKPVDASQQGGRSGQNNASFSLRRLHRAFGLQSALEDKDRPRPRGNERDPSSPAKPAKTGRRKSRRNRMAQRSEQSAPKPSTSTSSSMGDNGDNGDDDDHVPLWKVMEESESSPAAEEPTLTAEVNSPHYEQPEAGPRSLSTVKATDLQIDALEIPQPPVPSLEYGLDKVLFNPGVYQLQDPTSRVFNFDPYLEHIMPAVEFDFNALKEYKTSSEDRALSAIAKEHSKKYIGSTSSMTSTLAHFHYLLSNWRPLNLDMLSRGFVDQADEFTKINRAPTAIFLRWKPESKTYAIDADKEHDSPNVLMMLGKSMEKLLTLPMSEFEKYRKSDPREVSDEMRNEPEAFQYTTMGDFLMRSQLDAYDARLPGTGMFDLKTRAALPVRMDAEDFEPMLGYEIHSLQGRWNSYEREYYDMMRSTMLKYMLQARMGRMQGIFAAYHNVQRIFGFQYISIMDMDRALHGQIDPCLGDQEFKMSLELLNATLNKATVKFPEKSLRIHFETVSQNLGGESTPVMHIFAEPVAEKEIERIQNVSKEKVREFEQKVMGIEQKGAKPASQKTAVPEDKPEDQAPTEYPPATPEPPNEAPESSPTEGQEDSVPTTYPPATPEPPSTPSPNPDFNSSTSAADADFLSSLGPSPTTFSPTTPPSSPTSSSSSDSSFAPLFAATLMTKSYVNGAHVARPAPLKPDDDWTVEYLLEDYPVREAEWARYEAVKGRRKEVLVREREEEQVGVEGKRRDGFIEFLRNLAGQGREFRKKIDAAEAGRAKKVAWEVDGGGASAAAARGGERGEEVVRDVGGYLEWLYSGGKKA